jgi:hypothetical protein
MTPIREAFVLPLIFLTVALLGGVRLGTGVALAPPPLFTLVLATMLIAALVRSGTLAPERLLHGSRPILANTNGAVVLATLFAAAAQVLAMLTPHSGLPLFFVSVFLFVLLLNTLVAQPDRVRLLRSLAVILGSALVLKFVILASLSGPSGSRTARVPGRTVRRRHLRHDHARATVAGRRLSRLPGDGALPYRRGRPAGGAARTLPRHHGPREFPR